MVNFNGKYYPNILFPQKELDNPSINSFMIRLNQNLLIIQQGHPAFCVKCGQTQANIRFLSCKNCGCPNWLIKMGYYDVEVVNNIPFRSMANIRHRRSRR